MEECALSARPRCRTTACESLRTSRYDNGEPNRVVAQMLLNALDTNISWDWRGKNEKPARICLLRNHQHQQSVGKDIAQFGGEKYVISFGLQSQPLQRRARKALRRTDLFVVLAESKNHTKDRRNDEERDVPVLALFAEVADASAPCAPLDTCTRNDSTTPHFSYLYQRKYVQHSDWLRTILQQALPFCTSVIPEGT